MTESTDSGNSTALLTWGNLTVIDQSDADFVISCTPKSGSEFPVGITEVVCEAVDSNGNGATCGFSVNVTGMYICHRFFLLFIIKVMLKPHNVL